MTIVPPSLEQMRARHRALDAHVVRTPTTRLASDRLNGLLGTRGIYLKLELFQHAGSFKARGAFSVVQNQAQDRAGVTAVSAGNHAIATAWAARAAGKSAKVVMQSTANPFRIAAARAQGAEVVLAPPGPPSFAAAEAIAADEDRLLVHPFEGVDTTLGASGVGLELMDDVPALDVVIVAVGGGGLMSGVATAVKAINPACTVLGVEPEGASSMSQSLAVGKPVTLEKTMTIADSLAPPMALPYGFALCSAGVDAMATVTDDAICQAMVELQEEARLAVEPAAAAPLAAALGPFRERLRGKAVGLVICGANIDSETYGDLLARGRLIRAER